MRLHDLDDLLPDIPAPKPIAMPTSQLVLDDLTPEQLAQGDVYAKAAVNGGLRELHAMKAAATPNGQGYTGPEWNSTTFRITRQIIEVAKAGWNTLTPEKATEMVMAAAPTDAGFPPAVVFDMVRRAIEECEPRPMPNLGERGSIFEERGTAPSSATTDKAAAVLTGSSRDDGNTKGMGAEELIAQARMDFLITQDERATAMAVAADGTGRPVPIESKRFADGLRLAAFKTGPVPKADALQAAISTLAAIGRSAEPITLHLRSAYVGGQIIVDLGEPNSCRCVVITSFGWTVEDAPPPGIYFRTTSASRPLPVPVRGGSLDELMAVLDFPRDSQNAQLLTGWLLGAPFPDFARPILFFAGSAGSGKTSRAKMLVNVLDPREELGSSFGRNADSDQVAAIARYCSAYDNLPRKLSDTMQDFLCRLSTGDERSSRELYTNAEAFVVAYRRLVVMTGISMPPLRPDTLERVVLIPVPAPTARRGERQLAAEFDAGHPRVLGALCDALVGVLARLPTVQRVAGRDSRFADYLDVLEAHDPALVAAYLASKESTLEDVAESDPFVSTVRAFLEQEGGKWVGRPVQAWQGAALKRAIAVGADQSWWPNSAARFTVELDAQRDALAAIGVTATSRRSNGVRTLTLEMNR